MQNRLSFYIPRKSPIHSLNPLTKLVLVFTCIILGFFSLWDWLPSAIFLVFLIPLSFIGKVGKEFMRTTVRLLLPLFAFLFAMQSLFYPGGITPLFSFWIFSVKLEGVQFAFLTGTRILVMVSAFLLLLLTTHPSTLMSDLTRRGLPPELSYIITSTLQIIPQMQSKAGTIIDAQRSRGLNTEGNIFRRAGALFPLVGPLVFGSLVDVEERAIAIEARAFNAPHVKTSLIEITDTRLERALRWFFLVLILLAIGGKIWLS